MAIEPISLLDDLSDSDDESPDSQESDVGIHFLSIVLDKAKAFSTHIDNQAQILIGVSSAIFIFAASKVEEGNNHAGLFYVLGFFAALTALVALVGIHPPHWLRKRGQPESLIYNREIISFASAADYEKALRPLLNDRSELIHQYTMEIYNMYKYYYRPKRIIFNFARVLLFIGIILSFITFILGSFG